MSCRAVDEPGAEAAHRPGGGGPWLGDGQRDQQPGAARPGAQSYAGTTTGGGSIGGDNGSAPKTSRELPPWPQRSSCAYQACYCEENVWLLARSLQASHGRVLQLFAVFVSNHSKTVPLWRQRAAAHPDAPVVWDYHVLMLARPAEGPTWVLDLDCTLEPFPCTLEQYRQQALLGAGGGLPVQYHRCYRVVPVQLFLAHFASDRSHMRDAGGGWLQPPPSWPCILGNQAAAACAAVGSEGKGGSSSSGSGSNTLPAFLAFPTLEQLGGDWQQAAAPWLGSVMSERAFLEAFGVA